MKVLTFSCLAAGVFGDTLCHINKYDELFQSNAGPVDDPGWTKINGRKTDIGCNVYDKCWAVNEGGDIWYADLWNAWNGDQPSWQKKSTGSIREAVEKVRTASIHPKLHYAKKMRNLSSLF